MVIQKEVSPRTLSVDSVTVQETFKDRPNSFFSFFYSLFLAKTLSFLSSFLPPHLLRIV